MSMVYPEALRGARSLDALVLTLCGRLSSLTKACDIRVVFDVTIYFNYCEGNFLDLKTKIRNPFA